MKQLRLENIQKRIMDTLHERGYENFTLKENMFISWDDSRRFLHLVGLDGERRYDFRRSMMRLNKMDDDGIVNTFVELIERQLNPKLWMEE